jgi:hypothetical protein
MFDILRLFIPAPSIREINGLEKMSNQTSRILKKCKTRKKEVEKELLEREQNQLLLDSNLKRKESRKINKTLKKIKKDLYRPKLERFSNKFIECYESYLHKTWGVFNDPDVYFLTGVNEEYENEIIFHNSKFSKMEKTDYQIARIIKENKIDFRFLSPYLNFFINDKECQQIVEEDFFELYEFTYKFDLKKLTDYYELILSNYKFEESQFHDDTQTGNLLIVFLDKIDAAMYRKKIYIDNLGGLPNEEIPKLKISIQIRKENLKFRVSQFTRVRKELQVLLMEYVSTSPARYIRRTKFACISILYKLKRLYEFYVNELKEIYQIVCEQLQSLSEELQAIGQQLKDVLEEFKTFIEELEIIPEFLTSLINNVASNKSKFSYKTPSLNNIKFFKTRHTKFKIVNTKFSNQFSNPLLKKSNNFMSRFITQKDLFLDSIDVNLENNIQDKLDFFYFTFLELKNILDEIEKLRIFSEAKLNINQIKFSVVQELFRQTTPLEKLKLKVDNLTEVDITNHNLEELERKINFSEKLFLELNSLENYLKNYLKRLEKQTKDVETYGLQINCSKISNLFPFLEMDDSEIHFDDQFILIPRFFNYELYENLNIGPKKKFTKNELEEFLEFPKEMLTKSGFKGTPIFSGFIHHILQEYNKKTFYATYNYDPYKKFLAAQQKFLNEQKELEEKNKIILKKDPTAKVEPLKIEGKDFEKFIPFPVTNSENFHNTVLTEKNKFFKEFQKGFKKLHSKIKRKIKDAKKIDLLINFLDETDIDNNIIEKTNNYIDVIK